MLATQFDPFRFSETMEQGPVSLGQNGAVHSYVLNQNGPTLIARLNQHVQRLALPTQADFMYTPTWTRGIRNKPYGVVFRQIAMYVRENVWPGLGEQAGQRKELLIARLNDRAALDDQLALVLDLKGSAVAVTTSCQGWEADPDNSLDYDLDYRTLSSLHRKRKNLEQKLCQLLFIEQENRKHCPVGASQLRDHFMQHIDQAKNSILDQLKLNMEYQRQVLRVVLRNALGLHWNLLGQAAPKTGTLTDQIKRCWQVADSDQKDKSLLELYIGQALPELDAPQLARGLRELYVKLQAETPLLKAQPEGKLTGPSATEALFAERQELLTKLAAVQEQASDPSELLASLRANMQQEEACVRSDLLRVLESIQAPDYSELAFPELVTAASGWLQEQRTEEPAIKRRLALAYEPVKQLYQHMDSLRLREQLMTFWFQLQTLGSHYLPARD